MDVEAIGLVVHGAHRVGLEDAVLFGEVLLGEGLRGGECGGGGKASGRTYDFVVIVTDLLAHELVGPFIDLVATLALESWHDERHVECRLGCKGSLEEGAVQKSRGGRGGWGQQRRGRSGWRTGVFMRRIPVDGRLARDSEETYESWALLACVGAAAEGTTSGAGRGGGGGGPRDFGGGDKKHTKWGGNKKHTK